MRVRSTAWWPLLLATCVLISGPAVGAGEETKKEYYPPAPRPYHHITVTGGFWFEGADAPELNDPTHKEWFTAGMYGLGYEYRTSANQGLCFFFQRAGGEANADLLGGGVGLHFDKGWWILIASMWQRRQGDNSGKLRFGINHEFRAGSKKLTTITPALNFDMAEGGFNFVFGLSFGRLIK